MSQNNRIKVGPFTIVEERYRGTAYPDKYSYSIFQSGVYVITCRTEEDARRVISYLKPPVFPQKKEED